MPYSHTHEESQWLASLWSAYGRSGKSTTIRNQLVAYYYDLLAPLVDHLCRRLPRHVDRDLLESAAGQGLMEAVEQFDALKSDNFRRFAHLVMRRRVTDALRQHVPRRGSLATPQGARRTQDEVTLSQKLGRRPSEEELDQFVCQNATHGRADSMSVMRRRNRAASILRVSSAALDAAASCSRDIRDAAIVHLYVRDDFSQQRIAELFGITQPRVSQILRAARATYVANESIDGGRRDRRSTRPTSPREDHR